MYLRAWCKYLQYYLFFIYFRIDLFLLKDVGIWELLFFDNQIKKMKEGGFCLIKHVSLKDKRNLLLTSNTNYFKELIKNCFICLMKKFTILFSFLADLFLIDK